MFTLADWYAEKIEMQEYDRFFAAARAGNPVLISIGTYNLIGIAHIGEKFGLKEYSELPEVLSGAVLSDSKYGSIWDFLYHDAQGEWQSPDVLENLVESTAVVLDYSAKGIKAGVIHQTYFIEHPQDEQSPLYLDGLKSVKILDYRQTALTVSSNNLAVEPYAPRDMPTSYVPDDNTQNVLGMLLNGAGPFHAQTGRGVTINIANLTVTNNQTTNIFITAEAMEFLKQMMQRDASQEEITQFLMRQNLLK